MSGEGLCNSLSKFIFLYNELLLNSVVLSKSLGSLIETFHINFTLISFMGGGLFWFFHPCVCFIFIRSITLSYVMGWCDYCKHKSLCVQIYVLKQWSNYRTNSSHAVHMLSVLSRTEFVYCTWLGLVISWTPSWGGDSTFK